MDIRYNVRICGKRYKNKDKSDIIELLYKHEKELSVNCRSTINVIIFEINNAENTVTRIGFYGHNNKIIFLSINVNKGVYIMEKLNVNTNGNRKLRNTDKIRFMIWNLPAVKTCPFRTEMCEKSCYARKAERVYPQVLPSREKNYTDSLQADFVDRMIYTIEKELNTKKCKGKLTVFRIHESGDFYNREYFSKWYQIAKHFENDNRIVFLAYTKSIPYAIQCGYGLPWFSKNLVIRSSLWEDTKIDYLTLTVLHKFPIYTAYTREEMDAQKKDGRIFTECRCEDCANCGYCWNKEYKEIICEIH